MPAELCILTPRATTVFTGLWHAVASRDFLVGAIAFAGVLSKFMPIFLSNVPFRLTLTWETHLFSAWTSVGILGFMITVLMASRVFARWPSLLVEPNSIAGCMYYVCDSNMLEGLKGGTVLCDNKQTAPRPKQVKEWYGFGEMTGISGELRIGIYRAGAATDAKSRRPRCKLGRYSPDSNSNFP
jgi:hypothetical protein